MQAAIGQAIRESGFDKESLDQVQVLASGRKSVDCKGTVLGYFGINELD